MLDVATLQQENSSLREQLTELRAQLTHLIAGNAELATTIAKLNERVAELLAVAQRKQRKPSPPKPPESPPALEGESKLAFESRPKPPELPPKTKETNEAAAVLDESVADEAKLLGLCLVEVHGREEAVALSGQRRLRSLCVFGLSDAVRVAAALEDAARYVDCVEAMFSIGGERAAESVELPGEFVTRLGGRVLEHRAGEVSVQLDVPVVRRRQTGMRTLRPVPSVAIHAEASSCCQCSPSMGASRSAARSMKDTRVPIAIGMPRSFKSRRVLSSGVSNENFVITNQASQSPVTFERAYGAGSERGVVRPPQSRQRHVVRFTTRRRWCSLTTSSFSSSMTSAASSAVLPQCAHSSGFNSCASTGRCFGSALRPVGGGRGFFSRAA